MPGAEPVERVAAIIGADGAIGGFTPLVEWVAPAAAGREAARLRPHARAGRDDAGRGRAAGRRLGAARRARGREHGALPRGPDRPMKVAVVGAGVMGCATAWALRERGAEVTRARAVRARSRPRLEPRSHAHLPGRVSRAGLDPVRAGRVRGLARPRSRSARPLRADRARRGPGADLGARARRVRRAVPAARPRTRCARRARSSRRAGRRCTPPTRASSSPIARATRSSRPPASRSRRTAASSRPTSSTRTSSSSPPAPGSATSSRTCR